MWCYQKPGFEGLLLTELQKQQQCRQFCDTLLKTEGVSVPAHSCILSAISPHISAALSSTPPPPAGQSHLLDFRPLGACSLLHMVRLLYSGEMAGEGEEEKQEAISAAARLGIHGLVEVTRRVCKCRHEEGEGRRAEVGVQTEPLMPEENEGRCGRWGREMRDGRTFLWKETLSGGGKETWTQTEEPDGSHPAASFETIDLAALQSLGQTDTSLPPSQIPYVPISLVYPQDENQAHQPSAATVDSMQESTAAAVAPPYTSLRPFSSQETPCAAVPHSWCSGLQRAGGNVPAAEEWTDEQILQFQGNIPGYINYFLNPEKQESSARGRARRRRGAGVGAARRAGAGERRARRPRARTGARGRGGLMQTVDVQEVKEGKLQKLFLHRWGTRASRMGQGGGAAGRKLYLKTRDLLKPVKKRIRRGKGLDFSPGGDVPLHSEEGAGNTQHGRKSATQQFNQRLYNNTLSASSPSFQPSSPPHLLSPAPSFLQTTPIPPPPPPPHEEHFDRLIEEVMMGLDILPNNNSASHSQPPFPARRSANASSGSTLTRNRQQGRAADLLDAGPGFHGSTQVAGGSDCADSEVPSLQQQREGDFNEMLNLLLSFEQHTDSCAATEEMEMSGQSCTELINAEAESHRAQTHSAVTVGTPEKVKEPAKRRKKRRKNEYPLSFERKRVRKPALLSDEKTKMVHDRQDKQLQQMPVVKLERSGPLPVRVRLQGHSSQSLEVKSVNFSSSSVRCRRKKNKQIYCNLKMYPIRSRFREACVDSTPFLEEPLRHKRPPSSHQPGHRPKNKVSLCNSENPTPPIQRQPADEQQERHEEEWTLPPQLEAEEPDRRGKKRGAESEEEISDDDRVAKRVCFQQMPQLTPETCTRSCESADFEPAAVEVEDVIDEMTVSLTRVEDCLQKGEREEETAPSEIRCAAGEEVESSDDEIIDVGGDVEDRGEPEKDCRQSATAPREKPSASSASCSEGSLRSTASSEEDKDDDIDVIGGSSPVPDPVTINWTDSSEDEKEEGDEDVDVVGGKTNYALSAVFTTMSEGKEEL